MGDCVIADSSCLMVLFNAGHLGLLPRVFRKINTTPEVALEFGEPLPEWILIEAAANRLHQHSLEQQLDVGEASCLALALEKPGFTLVIDERKGRKVATGLGLNVIGTIRIGIIAKEKGLIASLAPFLTDLRAAGFRASESLYEEALRLAGE